MRTNLRVPYSEKDEAKALGARWDPAQKVWYVKGAEDLGLFLRWMPAHLQAAHQHRPKVMVSAPITTRRTSDNLPELLCDCPPWEICIHHPDFDSEAHRHLQSIMWDDRSGR